MKIQQDAFLTEVQSALGLRSFFLREGRVKGTPIPAPHQEVRPFLLLLLIGVTWVAMNTNLSNTSLLSLVASSTTLHAGTNGGGLYKTTAGDP